MFLLPNRTHPVFPYGYEQLSLAGHALGSQNRTLWDKQVGTRKKGVKTKVMLGQKQGNRYGAFITDVVWVYSLIQRNHLHGDLPTKLNYYIFYYYKYYCGHSITSPECQKSLGSAPSKLWQNATGTSRASRLWMLSRRTWSSWPSHAAKTAPG